MLCGSVDGRVSEEGGGGRSAVVRLLIPWNTETAADCRRRREETLRSARTHREEGDEDRKSVV